MDNNTRRIMDLLHGGIAVYNGETGKFEFQYCPDQVIRLLGYSKAYFEDHIQADALKLLDTEDREQVEQTVTSARESGRGVCVCFPVQGGVGGLKWLQIDGWEGEDGYQLLFSGVSPEAQLFQRVADENDEDVYVIDKESYDLLYANQLSRIFCKEEGESGQKCYRFLKGRNSPCPHCAMRPRGEDETAPEMYYQEEGHFYVTRFQEIDWNGTPAYIKYVRDITEEVTVKREKERLEKYFETVLKHLPGGVAVVHHEVGGELETEYLSNGFADMVDMPMEQAWALYQDSALSGVHPEDRDYVKENLDRCITEKCERTDLQYRLRKGDGSYIWVSVKFSVIQSDGGEARVYADYNDITEEKKAQERERQRYGEQIFRHYLMSGPEVLILGHCNISRNEITEIQDRTGSRLLERFGKVREDFFTGIGTLVVDPEERKEFYSKYLNGPSLRAYEQGITEILMPCFVMLPGSAEGRYVQFKVNLLETPGTGDITGVLTVTDITRQVVRDKIFQRLSSFDYDLVADVDLLHDRFEIVSGGDSRLPEEQGCQSERVVRVLNELVTERERERVAQLLDPAQMMKRLKKEKSYSFTYSIAGESEDILTKNMVVSAIDLRLGRVCLVRTDVTDMLKAEREAKRTLEAALSAAEKASRVKSDFLSSMSHDIRTPMNAIVGMTALAQANIDKPDKIADYLHKISISSQHLLSLINDVLDMSQIEQSKIHMNDICIQSDELMDQISSIMMAQFKDAGIHFVMEKENITHPCFRGDMLRIKQILINLLSNAIKFTMEGGHVSFKLEETACQTAGKARYRFTVSDTGIGMSKEFQRHLFEPFVRSERVSGVEGTGLGHGTTFRIELEFDTVEDGPEAQTPGTLKEESEKSMAGLHFLVAEDNAINSEILGELLQMRGATCVLKEDGRQAVEEFQSSSPGTYDAIFMDVQMPVMNGYEATRAIRALPRPDAREIVILAMTANAFAEDVQKAMESGMNGHIAKPVDMRLLCSTLSELLPPREKEP